MKKISALLLSALILFLSGCTVLEVMPGRASDFVEITDIDNDLICGCYSLEINGDYAVFCATRSLDENGNILAETYEDTEFVEFENHIILYNLKKNKLIGDYNVDKSIISDVWGCELTDEEIILFDDQNDYHFDMQMNYSNKTEKQETDFNLIAVNSPFYSEGRMAVNDGYMDYSTLTSNRYTILFDDLSKVYIDDDYKNINSYYEPSKLFLTNEIDADTTAVTFSVDDYDNLLRLNSVDLRADSKGTDNIYVNFAVLGEHYACIAADYVSYEPDKDYENVMYTSMYIWRYTENKSETPLSTKVITNDELIEENERLVSEIKDTYNIDIRFNEMCEAIQYSVDISEKINELDKNISIISIKDFVKSLPDGMVKEIYSGFNLSDNERDGIRIDVVGDITNDNSVAFALDMASPQMEICFELNSVDTYTIAHEFMHLFDARINDYYNGILDNSNLYDYWESLNDGYFYTGEIGDDELYHRYTFDENHFIIDYAATNDQEDRAVIFGYMYQYKASEEDRLTREGIRKKADALCELLKKAFPSVRNAESLIWESNLNS